MTRRGKVVGAGAALLLVLVIALGWRGGRLLSVTESTERSSYYFRLKASYTHDDQPIDFDIVVACGIRIDRYKSGDSGFLAARYPRFFVKETHDGHAVMQIVPIACRGETTASGDVPEDFLPGVIWFDKPGDYRFGIAYVSEDAFESPKSQLKFHGASIEKATHEDWMVFEKRAAANEGMRSRYYERTYSDEEARKIAAGGGSEIESAFARGCSGVVRFKLSAAARKIVRDFWPADEPIYWSSISWAAGPWPRLRTLQRTEPIFESGHRYKDHLIGSTYRYGGFPTRKGGGMIRKGSRSIFPPAIFPAGSDRGVPWVFTERVRKSDYLAKNVEVRTGQGRGFLYCFTSLTPGKDELEIPLPGFRNRETVVTVDGQRVHIPDRKNWYWVSPFYERDEYIYFKFAISLS